MSIRDIIQHSVNKNPLGMKEALEEEMRERIALAIQAKMTEGSFDQEELDEENDEDVLSEMSDEDDDMDDDEDDDEDLDEAAGGTHTVSIDHMGDYARDANAKKHNITLKRTSKSMPHVHDATGKKKDLQKYLAKHYGSHEDAKDIHPEVF